MSNNDDNSHDECSTTKSLHRRLVSCSVIGIFSISIIVATVSSVPLYRELKNDRAASLLQTAENRSRTTEQLLARSLDIAQQVTSRTRIRQQLEAYNRGEIDLPTLIDFTRDKLIEPLKLSEAMAAIARYDTQGALVVQVGSPIPDLFQIVPPCQGNKLLLGKPFLIADQPYFLVQAPIKNPNTREKVGTDVVLFHGKMLQQILQSPHGLGETGKVFLATTEADQVSIFPLLSVEETALLRELEQVSSETILQGNQGVVNLPNYRSLLAVTPVENTDWWVLTVQDKSELYAPLRGQVLNIALLIIVLSIVQTGGIIFLLRPLANLVLVRAERFEQVSQRLQAACEQSPASIVITDAKGNIEYVNPKFEQVTGYSAAEVMGKNPRVLKAGDMTAEGYQQLWETISAGKEWHGEFHNRSKTGELFWEWASISPIKNDAGEITHYVAVKEDITERKKSEEALFFQANYDAVTSLPNRTLGFNRLETNLKQAARQRTKIAVIFLDLDQFKRVNDSLGHQMGDHLLQTIARRLQKLLRNTDTVARFGGDEFLIIIPDLQEKEAVSAIAQSLINAVRQPLQLKNETIIVSASLGITFYPDDSVQPEELIQQADTAMYVAKREGRNQFTFFTAEMDHAAQYHLRVESRLRSALTNQEIFALYQPFVELSTGKVVGAEVLMRWRNQDLGNIPPNHFIPLAEETGLIHNLGKWVLSQACQEASHWQNHQHSLWVAVNLSPQQLKEPNFYNVVLEAVQKSGLPLHCLELEITENLLIEQVPEAKSILEQFRSAGIKLSVDDFGTGYSSLQYLRQYSFTTVKIDQSFIQDLPQNPEAVSLVKAILAIARELNLNTIAEGIETSEQLEFITRHGCTYGQGYFFSQPLPAPEFRQYIHRRNRQLTINN